MNPGSLLLAAPGLALLAAGSRLTDAGLTYAGGVMTAVTVAGFAWMVRSVRMAVVSKNEEVTRRVVKEVMTDQLAGLRAELHGVAQDVDQARAEAAAAHRRIDGFMAGEGPHRP